MGQRVRVTVYTEDGQEVITTTSFFDGLKAARKWLDAWVDKPASEAAPAITSILLERLDA